MPKIIEVRSHSNPKIVYRVDVDGQRCSCPAWTFQRHKRGPCKHLIALLAGRTIKGSRVVDLTETEVKRIWPVKAPQLDL